MAQLIALESTTIDRIWPIPPSEGAVILMVILPRMRSKAAQTSFKQQKPLPTALIRMILH